MFREDLRKRILTEAVITNTTKSKSKMKTSPFHKTLRNFYIAVLFACAAYMVSVIAKINKICSQKYNRTSTVPDEVIKITSQ